MFQYAAFRKWHRWLGLACAAFVFSSALTGTALLLKKRFAVLQPPTQRGVADHPENFITIDRAIHVALASGHTEFRVVGDVDRIDVRPNKGVYKIRSTRYGEVQIDATTGAVLSTGTRASDLLEDLHDGSLVGSWFHALVMPTYGLALLVLSVTGLVVWYLPWNIRRRKRVAATRSPRSRASCGVRAQDSERFHRDSRSR